MEFEVGRKTLDAEGKENREGQEAKETLPMSNTANTSLPLTPAPISKLQTPNSQLHTPNGTRKSPDVKRQTAASKLSAPNSKPPTRFYEDVLDENFNAYFAAARGNDSIDDEIALVKVKIKFILAEEPDNHQLFFQAVELLAKLVKAKYGTHKKDDKKLGDAIQSIIRDIGVPLDVAALNKKL
jgi:hypothetical protein